MDSEKPPWSAVDVKLASQSTEEAYRSSQATARSSTAVPSTVHVTMPPMKVFISFARPDHHFVHSLSGALMEHGITPLIAANRLSPGARLEDKVKAMIAESNCVIVLNTPASARSRWVNQEIGTAKALNKHILPLKTRQAQLAASPSR